MRSSQLNRVVLIGAATLLTACMSTGGSIDKGSPPRATSALRPVLTATFRPAGGVYGVTTGDGSAWATSGGSPLPHRSRHRQERTDPVTSRRLALDPWLRTGSLWVTDDSGILRVDPASGKVTGTIPIVTSILAFGNGALWTLDRAGMVRIDPHTLAVRTVRLPFEKRPGFAVGEGAAWMSVVNQQCFSGCLLGSRPRADASLLASGAPVCSGWSRPATEPCGSPTGIPS